MPGLHDALTRLANDPSFTDQLRSDPTSALRGYDLSASDLARLEAALGGSPSVTLASAVGGAATAAALPVAAGARGGAGLRGLLWLGGAVTAAAAGVALGFATAGTPVAASGILADAVTYRSCSDAHTTGSALGVLHRGDKVLVVGTSGPYVGVRDPRGSAVVWLDAAQVVIKDAARGLPALTCATAEPVAETSATGSDAPATPASPTPTLPGPSPQASPTASASASATASKPPASSTTTSTTMKPSTSTTKPATTTTKPTTTTTPPLAITVNTDLQVFYSEGGASCGAYPQYLSVFVKTSAPSRVASITVTWSGVGKSGTASNVGLGTWSIGPIYSTHNGTAPITVTVAVTDTSGVKKATTVSVGLRQIAEECIG